MQHQFQPSQINKLIEHSLAYQCACPAQVGKAILELRDLYRYQMECLIDTANDVQIHRAIAEATEKAHALMEACMARVLHIEGWDLETLEPPPQIKRAVGKSL
jgi:hypothetical protein